MQDPYFDRLLAAWLAKDETLFFALLYDRYKDQVLAMGWHFLPMLDQATSPDDILTEVFVRLMKKGLNYFHPDRFDEIGKLIAKTTRFAAYNSGRRRRKNLQHLGSSPGPERAEAEALSLEFSDYLEKLLQQLPAVKRRVFEMQHFGYSHQEIAEALQITVTNSRYHYTSAKKILRKLIAEANPLDDSSA